MNEILNSEFAAIVLRMTLVLFFGWLVIAMLRHRSPSLAMLVARCLLVAMWVGPLLILSGWSVPVGVLPGSNESIAVIPLKPEVTGRPAASASPADQITTAGPHRESMLVVADPGTIDVPQVAPAMGDALFDETAVPSAPSQTVIPARQVPLEYGGSEVLLAASIESDTPDQPGGVSFILCITWIAVVMFLSFRFTIRVSRTAGVVRRSTPCDRKIIDTRTRVAERLQIKSPARVRISREVSGPCTVGWFQPIVLLPAQWVNASHELTVSQTEMILAHELTHARDHDAGWDAVGQITCAVWWFHPLVAAISCEHRLACEHRCDAAASQVAGDADLYRRQLARWALAIRDLNQNSQSESQQAALISLSMAERPLMLKRLSWLKSGRLAENISTGCRLIAVAGVLLFGFLCTAVQPAQRVIAAQQADAPLAEDESQGDDQPGGAKAVEVPAPKPGEPAADAAAPAENHVLVAERRRMLVSIDAEPLYDWENPVTVSCVVLNEADEPIAGAEVMMSSLMDQSGESSTFMLEGGTLSDDRGALKIRLPGGTREFGVNVKAEGYAHFNNHWFEIADKVEVRMKSGRVIRVRATDEGGKLLPDAFPVVEDSNIWGREFTKQEDGTHLSPVLRPSRRWMRVVDDTAAEMADDNAVLFSDLIDLADDMSVDEAGISHIELSPGVRLDGELGDEVPRPVENGFVQVAVREGENHRIEGYNQTGLVWHEYVAIDPDGSFTFPSLPRDAHAQIFAICKGWQSASPTKDEVSQYFAEHDAGSDKLISDTVDRYNTKPQLFHLKSSGMPVMISVPCRQTAALDVRVLDPAGKPMVGASITMSPNLSFFGDLVIPGWGMWTRDLVRGGGAAPFGGPNDYAMFARDSFMELETDATGLARLRNLPNLSGSFEVAADGYVMSAYPTTDADKPGRYGLTGDMIPGKVRKMTITMERDLKPVGRELTVVDQTGKPLKEIKLTITAIATDAENPDWQQWSVRRFGARSTGQTNADGGVRLLHPQQIEDGEVKVLSLRLEGNVSRQSWLHADLTIPAIADGRGIRITDRLRSREEDAVGQYARATAEYADILKGHGVAPREILQALIKRNDLLALRQLLAASDYDAITPLELKSELNRSSFQDNSPVVKISTKNGERFVAMATVRPRGATWAKKPDRGFLPEAAFVFDVNGKLVRVLGGGTTLSNGDHNAMLANPGGTFDFFVKVSGFEAHPPYEYASRWHLIGDSEKPALTVYHQANSNSWSPYQGSKSPLAEFCFIGYGLNGVKIDAAATGLNAANLQVPRCVTWDRISGKFFGETSQSYEGKPMYKVIAEESARFQEVAAESGQVVVTGGRRDFQNWHMWNVVVQEGQSLTARLELRDEAGKTLRNIREDKLDAGQHSLQLMFGNPKQDADAKTEGADAVQQSLLVVMCDAKDLKQKTEYKIPHITVESRPTIEGQPAYFAAEPPLRILEKQSTDKTRSLVWVIE